LKSDSGMVPEYSDVIKRAQQGDSDAFTVLFHAHRPRIYSVCLRMTNNVAEAEDLTQDAFLQVFRKIGTYRGDAAFSTWVHRIAVNAVLMKFRKKLPCEVPLDEPYTNTDGAEMHREYGSKDRRLASCVDRMALASAIEELPHGYRTIFLLHEVEGHEHQEIGEMLGCSVGNSKSQLHHAKRRMRRLLASLPEGRPTTIRTDRSSTKSARPRLDHPVFQSLSCGNLYVVNPQLTPSSPGLMAADS
jgi:RNA polymerase sigma-70 factor, ECF subfamily